MNKRAMHRFEQFVFAFLAAVLVAYILVEVVELAYQFFRAVVSTENEKGRLLITKQQTREVLPVFFSILIAVELMNTLNVYVQEHRIVIKSVLLIGLMAIGRKLLTIDLTHADAVINLGLAALILALAVGYYLVSKADGPGPSPTA